MKSLRWIVPILILAAAISAGCKTTPEAQRHTCVDNLKVLYIATIQWADANDKATNDVPVMADLAKHLNRSAKCPSGGIYTLVPALQYPKCSVPGHVIDWPTTD